MADAGSTANLLAAGGDKNAAGAAAGGGEDKDPKKNFNYPLVKVCDMADELRTEAVDMVVTAVEKHPGNFEAAAQNIKELMDKRCGNSWHAVVGEGYGFEVTHEMRNLLYVYFGGNLGVLVWKAS
ncbi:dynein light chain type 1-domain-containing protein [Fimicolochytrium jonesii]|uniref:dynein light chain type 1-domain-containing protein n=1 Tax=Fimicolochytrium jonesii TaxID=1396493 RepID=UPI0022FDD2EB|nr:dynein light chain type 1-domain-containing protein [Fimicolochytrium jonesii]KAI8816615.1 dynein light chain type 1-domain-containing protein [Fimicolochytrium jonesii]